MNGWRKVLLGSVVTFQRGYDLPYRDRRLGAFPVVTSAGITDFHSKPMVNPPGVVTGRYGTIGGLFFIDQPFWPLNTTLYVRDFHGNDPRFIYFLLQQFDFESFSGKSGVPGVNRNDLHKEPVWIPASVAEQEEIAHALGDVELLLNELNLLIEKKRQIKQAAMQELLTGKRRLPGFEGEWAQVSLGSVAAMNSGGTPPTGRDDFYGGGIPWVSISDMTTSGRFISETERTLSDLGLANCAAKRFPAGTILYAMYASLGECSIAACEVTTSQAILGIRPSPSLASDYLYYYLCSIHDMVKQMGQLGTQSNLNKKIVQGFTLKLPKKSEQLAIARVLCEIDQELDAVKSMAKKIRNMKTGMMQNLLSGKIRLSKKLHDPASEDLITADNFRSREERK